MTLHVRAAAPDDAAALAALAALTFPLACPPGTDAADIREFVRGNLTAAHLAAHVADATCDVGLIGYEMALLVSRTEATLTPQLISEMRGNLPVNGATLPQS